MHLWKLHILHQFSGENHGNFCAVNFCKNDGFTGESFLPLPVGGGEFYFIHRLSGENKKNHR